MPVIFNSLLATKGYFGSKGRALQNLSQKTVIQSNQDTQMVISFLFVLSMPQTLFEYHVKCSDIYFTLPRLEVYRNAHSSDLMMIVG